MSKKKKSKKTETQNIGMDIDGELSEMMGRPTLFSDDINLNEQGFLGALDMLDQMQNMTPHQKMVESKLFQCDDCGEHAIMLIFANDATNDDEMHGYVHAMHDHIMKYKIPTWIIGPELEGPTEDEPHPTLKAYPIEGDKVEEIRPSEMNKTIMEHEENHCKKSSE